MAMNFWIDLFDFSTDLVFDIVDVEHISKL